MVKKTLLSLAIAATAAGLAGCKTGGDYKVDTGAVTAGSPGSEVSRVSPIFSAGGATLPLANDFLFADAGDTDGTANTSDTTPPVTTALNKLDGFATSAAIYVKFNAELDADTVAAGQTVLLVKLKNSEDNAAIDPLDISTIVENEGDNPFAADQPVAGTDYEARFITMDGGSTPAIQILPKTPLDPKTKYLVVLTDALESASGVEVGPSAEYDLVTSDLELPAPTLQPVRDAVQAWESLAGAFLNGATSGQVTQDNIILSYAFTTTGTTDVLHAMAAPATFLTTQITSIDAAEATISASVIATAIAGGADQATAEATAEGTLLTIAQGVAAAINAQAGTTVVPVDSTTRDVLKASETFSPNYYQGLITTIADGSGAGVDTIVDKPASRTYTPITADGSTAVEISYDAFLTVALRPGVEEANPDADESTVDAIVAGQVSAISSGGSILQGGLTIPNFLPLPEAGTADADLGSWSGSNNAALALGLESAPADADGSINVTWRFPYADKQGDVTVPVLAMIPDASCDPDGPGPASGKPADGWPVVIYQHGITVDRTAGLLVGNALASACIATIAIDHVMHGIAPLNDGEANSLRLFNVEQVAASDAATNSPFAAARAGVIQAVGAENVPGLAALAERHNNVGKAADQSNVSMVFQGALDAQGNPVTAASVGESGDLYINLNEFARTRDAIRQTVLDMLNVAASIDDMDVNSDGTADDLDPANVYFVGHSLGGIVGATFLSVANDTSVRAYNSNIPQIKAAALGNPGGGVVKLLENSAQIGPRIIAGLAASGVEQGSDSIESFFGVFQAMLDSADPINFAAGTADVPVLVYEDVGVTGDADEPSDQVVPNNAETATLATSVSFLAGTDPLVAEMGIDTLITKEEAETGSVISPDPQYYYPSTTNDAIVRANVRVAQGTHATFSSADPQAVFAEIYQQIGSFFDPYGATKLSGLAGDQQGLIIENTAVLESTGN